MILAPAFLSGCVNYAAKPLHPAQTLATFESRRLDDPALAARTNELFPGLASDWPPARWNRAQLLAVGLANSSALGAARAELAIAQARASVAGLRGEDSLIVQTEYARRERSPWLYGLGLELPIGGGARRRIDRSLADLRTESARTQVTGAAWTQRSELVGALSECEGQRRRALLLEQLVALQRQRVALFSQRIAAGEDASIDALPAREALLRSESEYATSSNAMARADGELARVLGLPRDALAAITIDWPDWGAPPPIAADALARAREQALLARSDLILAINDYSGAELDLQRAIAAQYPQFVLSPGYEWDHGIVKLPVSLGLTLPRPARNRAAIDEMQAAREAAGQRLITTQSAIHAEIENARVDEQLALAQVDAARRRLAEADELLRQRTLAVRVGATDRSDSLDAEILAREAALELLQRQTDGQAARLALENALHAPLSGPELDLRAAPAELDAIR